MADRMLQWFDFEHLPEPLRDVSRPFVQLAAHVGDTIEPGPERTVCLRKLLEAKDAAVRAHIEGERSKLPEPRRPIGGGDK